MAVLILTAAAGTACGRKGAPLPPLIRLPVAPADLKAERRALTVDVTMTVPAANTDGTRPASISRVDVYALTGPASTSDAAILKAGTKIASVAVKTPRDPNDAVSVDNPDTDIAAPEGPGLDQGVALHVSETLTAETMRSVHEEAAAAHAAAIGAERDRQHPLLGAAPEPLTGAPIEAPMRLYAAMGVNARGRPGPVSKRAAVPLVPFPAPPPQPDVTYDERAVTLKWPGPAATPAAADDDLLPSRPLMTTPMTTAYYVYDVPRAGGPNRLTAAPVTDPLFADQRIEWGAERCYAVSAVETVGTLSVESDRSAARCVTLKDAFPPAAPTALRAIPNQGVISLIWAPSTEKDLDGYIVLRGRTRDALMPVTPEPIARTSFDDPIGSDQNAFYAIEAVDKAGNVSPMSEVVEERSR